MTITITGDEIDAEQVIKFALENGAEIGDIDLSGNDISNVGALDTDSITSESVNTERADITNETLVKAVMSTDQSISTGAETMIELDTTLQDDRGEFDTANHQFSPDETGWFNVAVQTRFADAADGDRLILRLRDVTNNENIWAADTNNSGNQGSTVGTSGLVELENGVLYELQALNDNSTDTISSSNFYTYFTVRGAFR